MTDNAPERIWAKPEHPDENGYGGFWIKAKVAPAVEYIRLDLYTAVCAERDAAEAEVARLRKYQARAKIAEAATFNALERLDASLFTNAEHQQAKDILRCTLKPRPE